MSNYAGYSHIQCCYNQSYCYDLKTRQKLYTKLGEIDDKELLDELKEWKGKRDLEILGLPTKDIF